MSGRIELDGFGPYGMRSPEVPKLPSPGQDIENGFVIKFLSSEPVGKIADGPIGDLTVKALDRALDLTEKVDRRIQNARARVASDLDGSRPLGMRNPKAYERSRKRPGSRILDSSWFNKALESENAVSRALVIGATVTLAFKDGATENLIGRNEN